MIQKITTNKDDNPLVSIILPTYNRSQLLPRAINSVLEQDYDCWELIIIDDGSTDNTCCVVKSYKDERIKYTHFERNRGIGHARNWSVNHAQGDYIAFIDSDDKWLPGKLQNQIQIFQKHQQIEILFGDFININQTVATRERGFAQGTKALNSMKRRQLDETLWEIVDGFLRALLTGNFIAPSSVMFHKNVLYQVGNFNSSLSGPEDFEYWWRCGINECRIAYLTDPLIERYKDEQSITTSTTQFAPRYLQALDICENTAHQADREDLIQHLDEARFRVWRSLLKEYGKRGKRKQALKAFRMALHYDVTPSLFYVSGRIFVRSFCNSPWKRIAEKVKPKLTPD